MISERVELLGLDYFFIWINLYSNNHLETQIQEKFLNQNVRFIGRTFDLWSNTYIQFKVSVYKKKYQKDYDHNSC